MSVLGEIAAEKKPNKQRMMQLQGKAHLFHRNFITFTQEKIKAAVSKFSAIK